MDQGLNAERNSRLFLLFILYKLIVMERKRYCQLSGRCGGCSYVNIDYRDELLTKYILEEKFLKRFGKVSPIIPSDPYTGYRCKVQAVCRSEGNSLVTGIYRKGSHKLIPVKRCPLEDPRASEILSSIRTLSRRFGIQGYDEDLDSGLLRHVLIRIGARTGEVLVALVVSDENFSSSKDFAAALHQRHPNIKTVVAVRNREKTSMVIPEDAPEKILYGKGYIIDEICGLRFRISAKSFYQVNPYQAELLYQIAMNMAELREDDVVIDAYSGTGTISLIAASMNVAKVIGIESNHQAVLDARENARLNGISNAEFIEADASKKLKELAAASARCDVLFLDPPRSGATEEFLASASRLGPSVIVYVSCNPETLGRDLRYISRFMKDYRVRGIQPVDMFPGSEHVETVVLLSRMR